MAIAILIALYILAFDDTCHGQDYPFRNTSLSFEDRVKVSKSSVLLRTKYITRVHNGIIKYYCNGFMNTSKLTSVTIVAPQQEPNPLL